MSGDRTGHVALRARWLVVWIRAVIVPATRRADATWMGCGIVAAVIFGPTAMRPSDLTGLALHDPGAGAVIGATWLLMFVPVARMIVRPPARYLASLPGNPRAARLTGALALIVLQLPWVVLWIVGEGALGAGVVLATTAITVALARWQPPSRRPTTPSWRRAGAALRGIHRRALARRAGDALMRGAGLAVLAGLAAALLVRNNELVGASAGVLAASVIAVISVPAQIGPALITVAAHRDTAWLAASSGVSGATRVGALVYAVALVHVAVAAIAVAVVLWIAGPNAWLPPITLATALGTALGEARGMLVHQASPSAPTRVVVGAIVTAAIAVLCLGVLGPSGALAMIAIGAAALLRVAT